MKTQPRVLVGGLFHESHTFLPDLTSLNDCTVLRGDEMLSARGDASPLGSVLETAETLCWTVVPSIDLRATPSAPVTEDVLALWWSEFEHAVKAALKGGLDGVYLVLHGAMVSENSLDVEGDILQSLRVLIGDDIPIGGVTDLHANFSPRMAEYSNGLVTYRENPHTDGARTAQRAALLLHSLMRSGLRAQTVLEAPPLLLAPTATATADDPMRSLEAMARKIEAGNPEILAVNVHAGFAFADTPFTGVTFSAVTVGDPTVARQALKALSARAWDIRECGNLTEPSLEDVLPQVRTALDLKGGPVLLVEPADNIGGGAPGDGTHILRALLKHGFTNSGVVLNDPIAVANLQSLQVGQKARITLGGRSGNLSGGPLELEVEIISRSHGRFELEDPHSHLATLGGLSVEMGSCVLVKSGGNYILLTSRKTAPMDLGQWRSQGVDPESLSVIGVKAAVAHRQAYDPITRASFTISTPGPCTSDLNSLPYLHLSRPIWPLDTIKDHH